MISVATVIKNPLAKSLQSIGVIAISLLCGNAVADSSVWMASLDDEKIYLGGTVHLLRPSDYPLPDEYNRAYEDSSRVFFETDISSMNDLSVQTRMLQQLTYADNRTLKSVLSTEAYTALETYLSTLGMPIMMMEKFKPGLVVSTLQIMEFQKIGFTPQGVDVHFNDRALSDGKPVGELEPIQAQIDYIANMGEGYESEFILYSLQDMEDISDTMENLIAAWRSGDNDLLSELFIEEMKSESTELYDSLLVERNQMWMPIIEQMFNEDGTEFVLVGAAHLVGEDGLLSMLKAKGYHVKQL